MADLDDDTPVNRRVVLGLAFGGAFVAIGTDPAEARRLGRMSRFGRHGRPSWGILAMWAVIGVAGVAVVIALAWERWGKKPHTKPTVRAAKSSRIERNM